MADEDTTGTDWSSAELDAMVTDCLAMLRAEQSGQRPNKTAHGRALMGEIHRSNGSIEFKHQSISAVLTQLGLPRIERYKLAWNFQVAIADAMSRLRSFNAGRRDLSSKVRWVSQADGDGLGYDIRSHEESGAEKMDRGKNDKRRQHDAVLSDAQ